MQSSHSQNIVVLFTSFLLQVEVKAADSIDKRFPEIVDLSLGNHHAACIASDGKIVHSLPISIVNMMCLCLYLGSLYSWGSNEFGQLGWPKPKGGDAPVCRET